MTDRAPTAPGSRGRSRSARDLVARGRAVSAARAPAAAMVAPVRVAPASAVRAPALRMAGRSTATRRLRGGTPPGGTGSPATRGLRDRPGPIPIPARGRAASVARAPTARAPVVTVARVPVVTEARVQVPDPAIRSARVQVLLVPVRSAPASASANTAPMPPRIARSIRPRATSTNSRQGPKATRRPTSPSRSRRSSRPLRLRPVRRAVPTTGPARAVSRTVAHSDLAPRPRPAGLDRRSLRRPSIFSVRTRNSSPAGIRWKRPSSPTARPTACW
jgi:hypothetical protein